MSGSSLTFLLRPKWIAFHLLVFGAVALMVWLGLWQLQRLDDRRSFNDVVSERIDRPPVPLGELLDEARADPGSVEWRQVTLAGEYVPEQVVWFNRSQGGLAGDNVLTALVDPADDVTVIVNRGFVPLEIEPPPAPTGEVEVLGRIRVPAERQLGELTDATDGPLTEVRRIELERLATQFPGEMAPVYLDLIGSVPNAGPADPVPVPAPTLDEGPHLSYAVQWFIFATAVLVGWVLAVRRSIRSHRRAAERALTDAAAVRTPSDSPTSAAGASTTTTSRTGGS
jgi:cytochrome oxidase assembly protein ShyY1